MRRFVLWSAGLLGVAAVVLVLLVSAVTFALIAPAPVRAALDHEALLYPALTALRSKDSVHYGAHLLAGRTLALCPCTRRVAAVQYAKATWHARTPHQLALVTSDRPRTVGAVVSDAFWLGVDSMQWLGEHLF